MQLNDFIPAWRQIKLGHSFPGIASDEIFDIIDKNENKRTLKVKRVLLNVLMFVVITIICQGG